MSKAKRIIKTEKGVSGLLDCLYEELDMYRNGETTHQRLATISRNVAVIFIGMKVQSDTHRFINKTPDPIGYRIESRIDKEEAHP